MAARKSSCPFGKRNHFRKRSLLRELEMSNEVLDLWKDGYPDDSPLSWDEDDEIRWHAEYVSRHPNLQSAEQLAANGDTEGAVIAARKAMREGDAYEAQVASEILAKIHLGRVDFCLRADPPNFAEARRHLKEWQNLRKKGTAEKTFPEACELAAKFAAIPESGFSFCDFLSAALATHGRIIFCSGREQEAFALKTAAEEMLRPVREGCRMRKADEDFAKTVLLQLLDRMAKLDLDYAELGLLQAEIAAAIGMDEEAERMAAAVKREDLASQAFGMRAELVMKTDPERAVRLSACVAEAAGKGDRPTKIALLVQAMIKAGRIADARAVLDFTIGSLRQSGRSVPKVLSDLAADKRITAVKRIPDGKRLLADLIFDGVSAFGQVERLEAVAGRTYVIEDPSSGKKATVTPFAVSLPNRKKAAVTVPTERFSGRTFEPGTSLSLYCRMDGCFVRSVLGVKERNSGKDWDHAPSVMTVVETADEGRNLLVCRAGPKESMAFPLSVVRQAVPEVKAGDFLHVRAPEHSGQTSGLVLLDAERVSTKPVKLGEALIGTLSVSGEGEFRYGTVTTDDGAKIEVRPGLMAAIGGDVANGCRVRGIAVMHGTEKRAVMLEMAAAGN